MVDWPFLLLGGQAHFARISVIFIMRTTALFVLSILVAVNGFSSPPRASWSGPATREAKMTSAKGVLLEGEDKLVSPANFAYEQRFIHSLDWRGKTDFDLSP